MRRQTPNVVALAALLSAVLGIATVTACTRTDKPAHSSTASPSPVLDPSAAPAGDPVLIQSSPPPAGQGIRSIDFQNVIAPGYACFLSDSIQLTDGTGLTPSADGHRDPSDPNGPRYLRLSIINEPAFGVLAGYGPAAAVTFSCTNNGGTADGAILYSIGVYGAQGDLPLFVGLLLPKNRPRDELPTLVQARFVNGSLLVTERYYGPNDKTCCPSNTATTTWRFTAGALSSD